MDDHGVDSDAAATTLVAHAAWSAYRLAGGPDGGARPWLEIGPEGDRVAFGFSWQF
jgi:rhodanese-related sulfurtransferase